MAGPVGPRTAMGRKNPRPAGAVLKIQAKARTQKKPALAKGPAKAGGPAPLGCVIHSRPPAAALPTRRWN